MKSPLRLSTLIKTIFHLCSALSLLDLRSILNGSLSIIQYRATAAFLNMAIFSLSSFTAVKLRVVDFVMPECCTKFINTISTQFIHIIITADSSCNRLFTPEISREAMMPGK
jgi:hypothetical protein